MTDSQFQVAFTGGPNETLDPRHAPPGTLLAAENVVWDADGQAQVRYGYTQLGTNYAGSTSLIRATTLSTFRDELLCADGGLANLGGYNALLWNYRAQGTEWRPIDTISNVGVTHRPLQNATSSYAGQGIAIGGGYRVVAWVDAVDNQPRAAIYDLTLGSICEGIAMLVVPSAHPCSNVQVAIIGTTALVTAFDKTATAILGWTCDLTQAVLTWSASTTLTSSDYFGITSPVAVYSLSTFGGVKFWIAYETKSGATSQVQLRGFLTNLTPSASQTYTLGGAAPTVMNLALGGGGGDPQVWIAVGVATVATVISVNVNTLAGTLFGGIATGGNDFGTPIGVVRIDSSHAMVVGFGPFSTTFWTWYFTISSSGTIGHVTKLYNVYLASAPVFNSTTNTVFFWGRSVATAVSDTGLYLLEVQAQQAVSSSNDVQPSLWAICAPGIASGSILSSAPNICVNGTQYETVLPVIRSGARVGLDRFVFDFAANFRYQPAWLGRERYLSGARYDGARVAELGFAWPPWTYQDVNASGVGTFNGTRAYALTWLWVDAQGNAEESAPFFTNQVTAANNLQFNLIVATLTLTQKQRLGDAVTGAGSAVFLNVYRTQDLATGDNTYYRVTTDPIPISAKDQFSTASITYVDTATDITITRNATLYTTSGELAHSPPDQLTAVCAHKNRIWGIGADQRTIWYSQQYSDGSMPHWALIQQITVDDADEPLIAIGSLYDKLVVFSNRRIWVIYGDGPSISGTGNDLTEPQQIPSPCGCIDPRSVVQTPMGLMFQSARGIELLGPDLSVTFIGLPVSVTTKTYPTCTSAVLAENTSTVRFTMVQAEDYPKSPSNGGIVLTYDLRRSRWSVHILTRGGGGGSASSPGASPEAAVYHPIYGYVEAHNDTTSAAIVTRECTSADATPWLDYGTYFIPFAVQLAWIKNGDLQGWQSIRRVRVLAQYYDKHGLKAVFDYDYESTGETHSYTTQVVSGFVSGAHEQVRFRPARGKCEAISVTLSTTDPTLDGQALGSGRGAGFTGVAFEIHPKKGGYRRFPTAANS